MKKFINSLTNNLIKHIVKLRDNANYRTSCRQGVIYGEHLVMEALKVNNLATLLVLGKGEGEDELTTKYEHLLHLISGDRVYYINQNILNKLCNKLITTDIIAIIDFTVPDLDIDVYQEDCIILDNIQDPGNLGTILRSCRASGISNVIVSKHTVDVYNPKVLRASQGIQFQLNIYTNVDLQDFIHNYQGAIYATTPVALASIYEENFTNNKSNAFIFGNEGSGITQNLLNSKAKYVRIPMAYQVESLNVAMCATLCMFEVYRQRMNE